METSIEKLWKKVKEVYDYDHQGDLRLRTNNQLVSTVTSRGYRKVSLESKQYLLHRLIFLWHHGYFPKVVDHINGNVADNRIENLQGCDQKVNIAKASVFKTNNTGFKGVHFNKKANKYEAYYWNNYKKVYCGLHDTAEDAFNVREIKRKYGTNTT